MAAACATFQGQGWAGRQSKSLYESPTQLNLDIPSWHILQVKEHDSALHSWVLEVVTVQQSVGQEASFVFKLVDHVPNVPHAGSSADPVQNVCRLVAEERLDMTPFNGTSTTALYCK